MGRTKKKKGQEPNNQNENTSQSKNEEEEKTAGVDDFKIQHFNVDDEEKSQLATKDETQLLEDLVMGLTLEESP